VAHSILAMDDLEAAWVPLTTDDGCNSAHVISTADHHRVANVKLHVVNNLVGGNVDADGIIDLNIWVWIAHCAAIVSDSIWCAFRPPCDPLDTAQLIRSLFFVDLVQRKLALCVVQHAEILLGLLDLNDVLEASWEEHVSARLAVHLDQSLHCDLLALAIGQGILEAIAQHDNQWHAFPQLVWPSGWPWCPTALQLVKHPMRWRKHARQVLLWTTTHDCKCEAFLLQV